MHVCVCVFAYLMYAYSVCQCMHLCVCVCVYVCVCVTVGDCSVLWRGLMMDGSVNPVLVKVAQRTQPKKLAAFTRKLLDYIIYSTPQPTPSEHITKVVSRHKTCSCVKCEV